jgi:hypothetical protein
MSLQRGQTALQVAVEAENDDVAAVIRAAIIKQPAVQLLPSPDVYPLPSLDCVTHSRCTAHSKGADSADELADRPVHSLSLKQREDVVRCRECLKRFVSLQALRALASEVWVGVYSAAKKVSAAKTLTQSPSCRLVFAASLRP